MGGGGAAALLDGICHAHRGPAGLQCNRRLDPGGASGGSAPAQPPRMPGDLGSITSTAHTTFNTPHNTDSPDGCRPLQIECPIPSGHSKRHTMQVMQQQRSLSMRGSGRRQVVVQSLFKKKSAATVVAEPPAKTKKKVEAKKEVG